MGARGIAYLTLRLQSPQGNGAKIKSPSSNACACIRLQNGDEESSGRQNDEDRVKINGEAARSENEEESNEVRKGRR